MKNSNFFPAVIAFSLLNLTFNSFAITYNYDLGTLNPGATLSHSGTTVGMANVFGNAAPDAVYRVYIPSAMTIEINTCNATYYDSYLRLLNSSDTQITYDDDACLPSSRISNYSITSAGYYYIVVEGYSSYSGQYILTVIASGSSALSGGSISIGTTSVSSGTSPGTIASSVNASGGNGTYTYQWQQSTDNINWSNISGATNTTYTVPALYSTTYYRRMVTSGASTEYSNYVVISVTSALTSGSISIPTTSVCSGSSPGAFTNTTSPTGGSGSYSYQWQQSSDNSSWSSITGATSNTYTVPNLTSSTWFRRMVTSGGSTAYTSSIQITVTSCGGSSVSSVNGMTGAVSIGLTNSSSGTNRTISITGGTGTTIDVADNDNSMTNELQTLSISGNTLTLSPGNSSVTLPVSGGSSQWTTSGSNIYYNTSGGVSIGTSTMPAGYKLAVAGKIITDEVMVKTVGNWPDYVFDKNYNLRSLEELQNCIEINKHLPEIPSAQEMEEKGIGLSEMNMLLLKKIEELTLYILKQNKENEYQKNEIEALKKRILLIETKSK